MSIQELFPGALDGPGDDRLPPQDVHAEQSVLGSMLLSKDAIADAVEVLRGADFYRPAHESIYEAILDLYGRGEPADAVTVADELTKRGQLARVGGGAFLHQLISSVPTAANAGYYAHIVAERAVLRRLVEAGTRIVQLGYAQGGGDVEDIVNAAQAEVYGVSEKRGGEDYHKLGDIIELTVDEIEVASGRSGQMTGVPTGFTDLDSLTNGLHPGQMIVLAARPAMGKALALDTPLATPTGWTTMGEVAVGDEVMGADGHPTRVVAATDVMVGRPCYEVEFSDGSVLVADAEHQWQVAVFGERRILTTVDLAELLAHHVLTVIERLPAAGSTISPLVWKVEAVRAVESVLVRCIEVEAADHLYLAGRSMIPTHNSTLGLDIARTAAIKHGMASVVFSLEMSKTEITMRLLSAEAQIQLQHMRKGTMREDDWQRLAQTMGRVSDAPLFIDDSPNMSLMEIRAKCRRLKQRHNLKLVVIDYLQLMTSGKRVESRQQEVSEFSRALKLLAKELEVPVIAISQLNRGPEQRTDKRPQMSDLRESGCLTADTRVLRADTGAETTLGSLYAAGARGGPVWALDDTLGYVRRRMPHVFPRGVRPVFRLTLASGKTLRATANHPFLTYAGWSPLADLRTGTRVAVPRHVPAPAFFEPWEDPRVILLAHVLGDPAYSVDRGRANVVGDWLDELGVLAVKPHKRRVPKAIFHVSKPQIALFVSHLWSLSGSVSVAKSGDRGRIRMEAASRRLVEDVSRLLLRFGISTRLGVSAGAGGARAAYRLEVAGEDSQRRFLQEIGLHGESRKAAKRLLEIVRAVEEAGAGTAAVPPRVVEAMRQVMSVSAAPRPGVGGSGMGVAGARAGAAGERRAAGEPLREVAAVLDSADMDLYAVNDVLWDPVVSIEADGVEEVFDATVLGGHNFVANGIAVHNSIEQDADMVILLHREEAYEKETQRAGEADLIVAKHRNGPTDTIVVAFQGHYSRFTNMAQQF
ncbi:MAG: replicative DNA helicase [Actinomycetales bacterium]|nr:replicative DNA helicase [Candidatus Phosphoribacter baldrii]